MEKNEIKKALYKQNPIVHFSSIKNGLVRYFSRLGDVIIVFIIPVKENYLKQLYKFF